MPAHGMTAEEVVRLGEEIYDRDIRALVEPHHDGEFLLLDVLSGDYEIDKDELEVRRRLKARRPDSVRYLIRIGYPAAYWFGGMRRPGDK